MKDKQASTIKFKIDANNLPELAAVQKARLKANQKSNSLKGSIKIIGDLDEGSKNAAKKFRQAIIKSAKTL